MNLSSANFHKDTPLMTAYWRIALIGISVPNWNSYNNKSFSYYDNSHCLYFSRSKISNLSRLADWREREGEAFYACTYRHKQGHEHAWCKQGGASARVTLALLSSSRGTRFHHMPPHFCHAVSRLHSSCGANVRMSACTYVCSGLFRGLLASRPQPDSGPRPTGGTPALDHPW